VLTRFRVLTKLLVLLVSASLLANALFMVLAIVWGARHRANAGVAAAVQETYRRERLSVLAALPPHEGATVFLGDSLTQRGEWAELLGDPSVQNRGVAGDTTVGVLARAADAAAHGPSRVFLMAGVNDLLAGEPPSAVADRYAKIVDALRAAAPSARLYCQSVLPVREGLAAPAVTSAGVRALNDAIARIAAGGSCTYVDLFSVLADSSGSLDERFTMDGVHLTGEGYAAWARAIAPWHDAPR